jgi:hypothetical protein
MSRVMSKISDPSSNHPEVVHNSSAGPDLGEKAPSQLVRIVLSSPSGPGLWRKLHFRIKEIWIRPWSGSGCVDPDLLFTGLSFGLVRIS